MRENCLKMCVLARALPQNKAVQFHQKWRAKRSRTTGARGGFLVTFVRLLWVSTLKICNKKLVAASAKSHSRIRNRNGTCGAILVQITKVPCVVPGISARAVFHGPRSRFFASARGRAAILRAPWRRATLSTAALRGRCGLSARRGNGNDFAHGPNLFVLPILSDQWEPRIRAGVVEHEETCQLLARRGVL